MEIATLMQSSASDYQSLLDTALQLIAENYSPDPLSTPEADHRGFRQIVAFLTRRENVQLRQRALELRQIRQALRAAKSGGAHARPNRTDGIDCAPSQNNLPIQPS